MGLESPRKPNCSPPTEAFSDTNPTQELSTVDDEMENKWTRERDIKICFTTERTPPQQSAASSIVDDEDGWGRDVHTKMSISSLLKKVKKYKRRNQELSADCREQCSVLMDLQEDYTAIKLKLAEVQTELDSEDAMRQESMALRDLRLLELVRENDDLNKQVRNDATVIKQKDRTIARLEDSLQAKDALYLETLQERDKIIEAFLALLQSTAAAAADTTSDQGHLVRKAAAAKRLKRAKWNNVQKNVAPSTANGNGRWHRKNLLRRRKMSEEQVVPVNA
jgi:hypothetical protein